MGKPLSVNGAVSLSIWEHHCNHLSKSIDMETFPNLQALKDRIAAVNQLIASTPEVIPASTLNQLVYQGRPSLAVGESEKLF